MNFHIFTCNSCVCYDNRCKYSMSLTTGREEVFWDELEKEKSGYLSLVEFINMLRVSGAFYLYFNLNLVFSLKTDRNGTKDDQFLGVYSVINKQLGHYLACTIELWSTWEVWRARKKRNSCPRR